MEFRVIIILFHGLSTRARLSRAPRVSEEMN